jgi:hypothetical protein
MAKECYGRSHANQLIPSSLGDVSIRYLVWHWDAEVCTLDNSVYFQPCDLACLLHLNVTSLSRDRKRLLSMQSVHRKSSELVAVYTRSYSGSDSLTEFQSVHRLCGKLTTSAGFRLVVSTTSRLLSPRSIGNRLFAVTHPVSLTKFDALFSSTVAVRTHHLC